MKRLFALFAFLIFFFLISNVRATPAYAVDATSATECDVSDSTCLGAWNNDIRITIGHTLNATVIDQIILILTQKGWFFAVAPGSTICIDPFPGKCAAGAIAAQDLKDILLSHVGQEWNKSLQDILQQEIFNQAQRRGQNIFAGVPPSVNFDKLFPPCQQDSDKNCKIVYTAFGNINTDPSLFINRILQIILSFSGAIIILLLILAGYKLMTSQGDPEKIKEARERVTSAIIGLLFIVFSFVLYQFITHDVLHLPGFGG